MANIFSNPQNADINFDAIFNAKVDWPPSKAIPKVAHFVHAEVKELTWLEWAAVRAAVVNLKVEKVVIWVPEKAELKGWIWNRIQDMPEVTLRKIIMPKTVWGGRIDMAQQQADIIRLKILYEEGGIYLDSDLVALKSSDDIIYNNATRSTVMALQHKGDGIPNGMIMSKPGSPFVKRWIEQYKEIKDRNVWDQLSTSRPHAMYTDMDPDLTVLDGQSWFYPLSSQSDGDTTLKMLWFGKSWHDADKSYGTHFWHPTNQFAESITPKTIQTIDTPLFCKMRNIFDNLDNDGYYSTPPEKNENCTVTWTSALNPGKHRIFSDYRMSTDDLDTKWLDSSGFNNHGWAPKGTILQLNTTSGLSVRNVTAESYAVLPVPVDWDTRVWSVRMEFNMDTKVIAEGEGVGLFKIRMEEGGEILIRVRNENPFPGITLKLEWVGNKLASEKLQRLNDMIWVSQAGLPLKSGLHEVAITFDRRDRGYANLYLDGEQIANNSMPLIASPKIGQEIWFNALDWDNLDTGFRGTLNRFTMYADALTPQDIALAIKTTSYADEQMSKLISHIKVSHSTASLWAVFLPAVILTILLLFLSRRTKGLVMAMTEYWNCMPKLNIKHIPFFAKTAPWPVAEIASQLPLLEQEAKSERSKD